MSKNHFEGLFIPLTFKQKIIDLRHEYQDLIDKIIDEEFTYNHLHLITKFYTNIPN